MVKTFAALILANADTIAIVDEVRAYTQSSVPDGQQAIGWARVGTEAALVSPIMYGIPTASSLLDQSRAAHWQDANFVWEDGSEAKLVKNPAGRCWYESNDERVAILVHGDDMIIAGDQKAVARTIQYHEKRFEVRQRDLKRGEKAVWCGWNLDRSVEGDITLSMEDKQRELKDFLKEEHRFEVRCNAPPTDRDIVRLGDTDGRGGICPSRRCGALDDLGFLLSLNP